jgi:hypothetical protein
MAAPLDGVKVLASVLAYSAAQIGELERQGAMVCAVAP